MFSWIVIVSCVAAITLSTTVSVDKRFPSNRNGDQLTNMVVKDDRFYVAENGFLHVLGADLELIESFNTCVGDNCDNINKVLTMHDDVLVLCGTGNNGICQAWNGSTVKHSSSSDVSENNYLTLSSDIKKPAVGLVHDGDLFIGVTTGQGVGKKEIGDKTYNYFISRTKIDTEFSQVASVYLLDRDYVVYFRKIFQNDRYIYFLTNQRSDLSSSNFVSKLIRICVDELYHSNKQIKSYTDIVLSCEAEGVNYNLLQDAEFLPAKGILVAAFSKGVDPENPSSDSAVCVYTMAAVNDAVVRANEDFFTCSTRNSIDTTSAYFEMNLPQCQTKAQYETVKEGYLCPSLSDHVGSRSNVIGYIPPLQPNSTYKLENSRITKVKGIDRYDLYPDVLIGTDKGSISQFTLDDTLKLLTYGNHTVVDQGHGITDMYIDEDRVYVVTNRKISSVRNTDCSFYTCSKTMEGKNPSCGWCIVESRSTKKSDCPRGWLSSLSECVSIDASPKYISIHDIANTYITITVKHVPVDVTTGMRCKYQTGSRQFGGLIQALKIGFNTYKCGLISEKEHYELTVVLVAVKNSQSYFSQLFTYANTIIHIYDCDKYPTCRKCLVSPEVNCRWCPASLTCQSPPFSCPTQVNDTNKCAKIEDTSDVYLPNGITQEIKIKTANLIVGNDVTYTCAIEKNGITVQGSAVVDNTNLKCLLNVSFKEGSKMVLPLYVFQNRGSIAVAIENNIQVTVYTCEYLAADCTQCGALKPGRYDCKWCSSGHCGHSSLCSQGVTCPLPQITQVEPPSGGYKGGTKLNITGTDFGTDTADITDVMVGYVKCYGIVVKQIQHPDFDNINKEIHCTLERSSDINRIGLQNVTFEFKTVNVGHGTYAFKNPVVKMIKPGFGPLIGGTSITLSGTDLDIENDTPLVQLDTFPYIRDVVFDYPNLTFNTTRVTDLRTISTVRLIWNYDRYDSVNLTFSYLSTPNIVNISSDKSILSGGTWFHSTGSNLKNAANVYIIVEYAGENRAETCLASLDTLLECPSPPAPDPVKREMNENLGQSNSRRKRSTVGDSITVQTTIKMDGYEKTFPMEYFRDPELDMFRETFKVSKSYERKLIITGNYLSLVGRKENYKVSIGRGTCFVNEVTRTSIICIPQQENPDKAAQELEVAVQLGNFNQSVGYVRYEDIPVDTPDEQNIFVILLPIVGGMLLIGFIGTALFCYKYRRAKARVPRIMKHQTKTSDRKRVKDTARPSQRTAPRSKQQTQQCSDERTDYIELDVHQIRPVYQDLDVTTLQDPDRSVYQDPDLTTLQNADRSVYQDIDVTTLQNADRSVYQDIDVTTLHNPDRLVYQDIGRDRDQDQHVYTGLGGLR